MITSLLATIAFQESKPIRDGAARKIVDAMYSTYASCKTYQDTGEELSGNGKYSIKFTTSYVRPTKFYHEYTGRGFFEGRHVVWCKGSLISTDPKDIPENRQESGYLETYNWDTNNLKIESTTISRSMLGTNRIATMLFPSEIEAESCKDCEDLRVQGTETVRADLCDILFSKKYDLRVWISRKTHLLIRQDEDVSNKLVRIEFSPILNAKIPDSKFLFTPPNTRKKR